MLLQIFSFILHFTVEVVAGTCLLRMYMHLQRINLSSRGGNPMAPFVFTLTNWMVLPVHRFVPSMGQLDTASLVAAYAVLLAKHSLLWLVAGASAHWLSLVVNAGFELISITLTGLMWLLILYVLLSWIKTASNAGYFLAQLVDPLLRPIRQFLPHMGGVDLSPIALLLLIQIAGIVLHNLQMSFAM